VVVARGDIDLLDSARGVIDRFDLAGHFIRSLIESPELRLARGMAMGPSGRLYVANPLTNSIVVLTASGKIERTINSPLAAGPGQFNQPSDVSITADGRLLVLDNQNDRIEALTPSGAYIKQWPAPASDTQSSVHVLPLGDGRLVASDPSGALIDYPRAGGAPERLPLTAGAQPVEPLGLAPLAQGRILVTDARGGRLLVVPVPR